jgi:hypothetical protein
MKLIGAHKFKLVSSSILPLLIALLPSTAKALPDLTINVTRALMTIEYDFREFSADECAVQEGCIWSAGARKLLRVDVGVMNVGASDLQIGDPARRPDIFYWSPCHAHYHLRGLANYRLLTLNGHQVARAYKQGFCLRDDHPKMSYAGDAKFTCNFQGISRGWQDIYDKSLDCQWVDISGVPAGNYNLEIVVNPNRIFPESNYNNNKVVLRVYVPPRANIPVWQP